ncbi:S8 family serine peptidase [Massilia sp. G4R7]|uniref:S8 family serine peptidase n=1 Tax=Massilia phyllostachyos TaxID=2898585 RepID=A0ABS8Q9Z6_9BURK|nr:S8 family serine peptidase [Massilia phyllostachyos]MCD2518562.1 S8 family serine peptidase [Massilia phyllostachyos]
MPKTPPGPSEQPGPPPNGPDGRPSADDASAARMRDQARDAGAEPGSGDGPAASREFAGHRTVTERKKKYLVAPRPLPATAGFLLPAGLMPSLSLSSVHQALEGLGDIEVVDTVGGRSGPHPAGLGMPDEGVIVARMTEQKAGELQQRGQGRLIVERDQHLQLLDPMLRRPDLVSSLTPYSGPSVDVTVAVLGKDGAPLPEAEVSLFGGLLPSSAATGPDGVARLRLYGDDLHMISGLYVKPRADHWSLYQRDPDLNAREANVVMLRPLAEWPALRNLPRQNALGWGARAMRLDQVPPPMRGQGVKVAVIDSGVATTHGNLNRIRAGFDVINKAVDRNTWNVDTLGHGSHCTGVIAGADPSWGIRGFAPDAEIHVCKLFPGGQISQLIDALEYCIENGIDVVNLSLGGSAPSETLERQIVRAKQAGVACIAAAGNSGGPVQYPAASPHVLAVAAIGKADEFPPDSYHTETIGQDIDQQGYFTARFSCAGRQVDVCAPGVAVVSSVPPNNFAAWDGTSMAAPHITGLATLVLAHRPEFQGILRTRSAERVEHLFQVLRLSARPVATSDPIRIGYGMPDALVALGLSAPAGQFAAQWQVPAAAFGMAPGLMAGMLAGVPDGGARYPVGFAPLQAGAMPGFPFGLGVGNLRPAGW